MQFSESIACDCAHSLLENQVYVPMTTFATIVLDGQGRRTFLKKFATKWGLQKAANREI